jgi:hypothetical protein
MRGGRIRRWWWCSSVWEEDGIKRIELMVEYWVAVTDRFSFMFLVMCLPVTPAYVFEV